MGSQQAVIEGRSDFKIIMRLAWPAVLERIFQTMTQIIDLVMVGRLGAAAITAVGLSMLPLEYSIHLFQALSVGTTALVARFTGAGEGHKGGVVLRQSLIMSMGVMLIIGVVFYIFAPQIIVLMGAEVDVIEMGINYLRILVPGFVFMLFRMVVNSALRGVGDTKTPMVANVIVNICNAIGNYILIFGKLGLPAMGVNGAAISTSIARFVGALLLLILFARRHPALWAETIKSLRPDWKVMKRIGRVGLPASAEQLMQRLAQVFYLRIVASLGTVAFAAHQIALRAESISYMPGFGFAIAATALVGQNLGANRPRQAKKSGLAAWKVSATVMGVMGIVMFIFSRQFIMIFSPDPDIIELGSICLKIIAFAQIPMATGFVLAWGLRGAGDTRPVFFSTALATWIGRLAGAYFFVIVLDMGLAGAWYAMVLDWGMRATFMAVRFLGGKWSEVKV